MSRDSGGAIAGGRLRLPLWPTLMTVPAVIVLIGLGVWQVERLQWKTALIATRQAQLAAPLIELPARLGNPEELEYRRVRVSGRFRHEHEMFLAARSLNGNVGYHVVTPIERADGSFLLLDRGWIPLDRKDPSTRAAGQPAGVVTVEGVIRLPGARGWFTPKDVPTQNHWYVVDIAAMAAWAKLGPLLPVYVEAGAADPPGGLPIGGQVRVDLPNNHLQYAITWFALAIALVVIYALYCRRQRT